MSITFSARNKRWLYQFDRIIAGTRQRANRLLPKGWTRQQADEFDRIESARLYAIATGVTKLTPLIEDAVLLYLEQHAPNLKNCANLTRELAACHSAYAGRPLTDLADVAREYPKTAHKAESKTKLNQPPCATGWPTCAPPAAGRGSTTRWASTTRQSAWCCPRCATSGTSTLTEKSF
jgi:hypothetical protein